MKMKPLKEQEEVHNKQWTQKLQTFFLFFFFFTWWGSNEPYVHYFPLQLLGQGIYFL